MKYKAIIFDLDGVICFTDEYHFLAWQALAKKLGITNFTREDNAKQRGVSRMESLEVVLAKSDKKYTYEEKVELANYKNSLYVKMLQNMNESDLSNEVKSTLTELKNRGIKIAIGSSSKNAPLILNRLGILNLFDGISDGNNITKSKPNPEVFLKAAQFISVEPKECYVVEDAIAGIDAALAGGFTSVAIGDATKHSGAHYKISSFSELLNLPF
ncbi:MAG: beta-phosphoglucomutase [Clostridia bacterium]|nr:beta-phosphoglucomutase [Clostridia bacterium]